MVTEPNVKLNFGLNVLRKREDGFHDIETLFVPYFDICDRLEIIRGDDYSETSASLALRYDHHRSVAQAVSENGKLMITIARKEGVDWSPLKDLTAKAYEILDKDCNLGPVKIFLEKLSPVGAGLGGGSSDAASALIMLNGLFGLELSKDRLVEYASQLGSDCAFFIHNKAMFGEGKGEILSDFDFYCPYHIEVVVHGNLPVSTAEAYKGIVPQIPQMRLREVLKRPVCDWKELLVNDFEHTVFKAHPELAAIKQSLYNNGAVYASMSGSGSALFALYESR